MPRLAGVRLLLKWILLYSVLAAVVTAGISSLGRALCLPPYWPAEYLFRCRHGDYAPALASVLWGGAWSALIMSVYSAPAAVLLLTVARALRSRVPGMLLRVLASAVGGGIWIWIMRELEPSPLDFTVGWYAMGLGATVAAAVVWLATGPDAASEEGLRTS